MAKKKEEEITTVEAAPIKGVKKDVLRLDAIIEKEFDEIQDVSKIDTSVKQWYSWGNYALNYISTKNLFHGVAAGRISSAKGLSSTGKSLLFASVAKDPSVDMVIAIEAEGAGFTKELFEFAGGDTTKFRRVKCSTFGNYKINKKTGAIEEISDDKFPVKKETDDNLYVEGATRAVKRLINQIVFNKIQANIIIVLDSLANIQSVREKAGTADMGKRSQDINIFFRTFDNTFEETNIAFLFTNKVYKNFGNVYDPWVENGGEGAIYNPSLSLFLTAMASSDEVSDKDMTTEKEQRKTALGSSFKSIRARVDKSRFGTENRNITILIDFLTGGVLPYSGLFTICKDFGVLEKAGSYYTLDGVIEKPFYKKDFIRTMMSLGEDGLIKLQKKLEEAEKKMKEDHLKEQSGVDTNLEGIISKAVYEDAGEDDEFETQELVGAMEKDI